MKIRLSGSYVFFTIGVLLVTLLTFTRLTCPVCGGTGVIVGAGGLKVTDVEGTLLDYEVFDTGCAEIYSDFTYSVNISLLNETTVLRGGGLLVKFYHPSAVEIAEEKTAIGERAEELEVTLEEVVLTQEVGEGGTVITFTRRPTAAKFIFVEVPAGTTKTFEETIQFQGFGLEQVAGFGVDGVTHVISVAPPQDNIVCPYCNGTGKVPLTEWLRLRAGVL